MIIFTGALILNLQPPTRIVTTQHNRIDNTTMMGWQNRVNLFMSLSHFPCHWFARFPTLHVASINHQRFYILRYHVFSDISLSLVLTLQKSVSCAILISRRQAVDVSPSPTQQFRLYQPVKSTKKLKRLGRYNWCDDVGGINEKFAAFANRYWDACRIMRPRSGGRV